MALLRTIAGVQTNVEFASPSANLQRMFSWLADTSLAAADLIIFPECMLSGYCFDSLEEAQPAAETIPGPATDAIGEYCRINNKHVIFGMLEKLNAELPATVRQDAKQVLAPEKAIFNSVVLVGPQGLIATYRKLHLPGLGVDRFTTCGGKPLQVHEVNKMRIGMHICYDGIFPESGRIMSLAGADVLVLPTNWPPGADTFARYIPNARALENNVYFISVNRIGTERGFRFIGQSKICDTNGNTIVEANESDETIITATIDIDRARNKKIVRVPGKHVIDRWADRRPEFYNDILKPPKSYL